MTSAFELFKIGIGPSSSHTVGPMVAAKRFIDALERDGLVPRRIEAEIYGSLAWTGRGHGTDTAICLGLLGEAPDTVDPNGVADLVHHVQEIKQVPAGNNVLAEFNPARDIIFNMKDVLPGHSNGMRFSALDADGSVISEKIYYSIGGGFVVLEGEPADGKVTPVPYPFCTAEELLHICTKENLTIAEVQLANELAARFREEIDQRLDAIRDAMFACIDRGLRMEGELPGGLRVKRRAKGLYDELQERRNKNQRTSHEVMDWISTYAIAVNEENASGGRVVTAPTNGAAGIVPAVLRYYRDFCSEYTPEGSHTFLLTAAAIGSLIKRNASISGAEVGCQGEVGSAASMAAAGLAAVLGATPAQIENAAEIAIEHHLGMTCDPIGGLVQIPCIERNAFGANKAIAAASLALRGDGTHRVSLDEVIETMRQTGLDMQSKYKETSLGGLAVNVAEC
ncbi:L-serine ammonia-lyase [Microvirga sp. KLBC 81]|uniref:L-serine ammonia-lyase n=1 Tax=Microvirga sp. KLBC 81 TaxID=1862707 RepID=UPI000D513E20|nr:L-serine ammonia-lyase [Microvirga sp. KLBC 81]PVE21957.1 L-serine ammonia-lyase [Microvirga sp. KLBC 81]